MSACPSCKRRVSSSDIVCPHCKAALDTSLVGPNDDDDSIVDDGVFGTSQGQRDLSFGDDAVIFGDGVGDYDAFDAVDTGFVQKELTNARIFVGGATQNLLRADAIPEREPKASLDDADLTPYELHILQLVNGKRPVGRIRRKSGMEDPDVKLALAMLADKRLIRLVGHVSEDRKLAAREKRRTKLKAAKAKRHEGRERPSSGGDRGTARQAKSVEWHSSEGARSERSARSETPDEKTRVTPAPAASADRKRPAREVRAPTRITRSEVASETPEPSTRSSRKSASKSASGERAAERAAASSRDVAGEGARTTAKSAPQHRSLDLALDDEQPGAFAGDTEVIHTPVVDEKRPPEPLVDDEADAFEDDADATEVRPSLRSLVGADLAKTPRPSPASAEEPAPEDEVEEPALDDEEPALDDEDEDEEPALDERIHREVTLVRSIPLPPEARDAFDEPTGAVVLDDEQPRSLVSERDVVALSDEEIVGPVPLGEDVHDVPTGPVELQVGGPSSRHGHGFDDSVLPTGEVPVLSLSGFAADDATGAAALAPPASAVPPPMPVDDESPTLEPGAIEVLSLPSDFFTPLPVPVAPSVTLLPLPGTVAHAPPTTSAPPPPVASAPPVVVATQRAVAPALPGQAPPGSKPLPPTKAPAAKTPGKATANDDELDDAIADDSDEGEARDSGAAPVSYENRRKAEKIFDQAERDAAAGRFAGARMNAKLAMIYDPSLKRYRELYELWGSAAAQGASPAQLRKDVQLFQQAKDLELKGDYRGAVKLLEQALKLNPTGAPILNLLGVIQATRLKEYRKASDNLMKACELEPGNRSFKNNLGKVLGMAEDVRDKRVLDNDDGSAVKVKKMRPKLF